MSREGWAALPCCATGLSAVCDCGISDHTHLLFLGHGTIWCISFGYNLQIIFITFFISRTQSFYGQSEWIEGILC